MIISVSGPRAWKGKEYVNYPYVASVLETFDRAEKVITGGGAGIEQLALRFAQEESIEIHVIPPNIQRYGNVVAFEVRNKEIIRATDLAVIFWDGVIPYYSEFLRDVLSSGKHAYVAPLM